MLNVLISLLIPLTSVIGQTDPISSFEGVDVETISIGLSNFKDMALYQSDLYVADGGNGLAVYVISSDGGLVPSFRISGDGFSDYSAITVHDLSIVAFDSSSRRLVLYSRTDRLFDADIPIGSVISNLRGLTTVGDQIIAYGNGIGVYNIFSQTEYVTNNEISVYDLKEVDDKAILLSNLGILEYNPISPTELTVVYNQTSFKSSDRLFYNGSSLIVFSEGVQYLYSEGNLLPVGTYTYEIEQIVAYQSLHYLVNSEGIFRLDQNNEILDKQPLWAPHLIQKVLFHGQFAYIAQGVMGINIFEVNTVGHLSFSRNVDLPSNNVRLVETSENSIPFTVLVSEYDRIRMFSDIGDSFVDFVYHYEVTALSVLYPFIYLGNSTHFIVFEILDNGSPQVRFVEEQVAVSSISIFGDNMVVVDGDAVRLYSLSSPGSPLLLDTTFVSGVQVVQLTETFLYFATNRSVGAIDVGFQRFSGTIMNVSLGFNMNAINGIEVTNESVFLAGASNTIVRIDLPLTVSTEIVSVSTFDVGIGLLSLPDRRVLLVTATELILVNPSTLNFTSSYSLPLISFHVAFLSAEIFTIVIANGNDGYTLIKFLPSDNASALSSFPILLVFLLAIPSLLAILSSYWLWKYFSRKKMHQSPKIENDYL